MTVVRPGDECLEAPAVNVYDRPLTEAEIEKGWHRELVGGLWDEMGRLQRDFLVGEGLMPNMRLLDVGCGCLRAGIHLVPYLLDGNYYGLDINESLIRAGLEIELPRAGLAGCLSPGNLLVNGRFEAFRFGVLFDMAVAQSLFTHLPGERIRDCLSQLWRCLRPGARLYATFFECSQEGPGLLPETHPGGITTYANRDPYHFRFEEIARLSDGLPWVLSRVPGFRHPRDQKMLRFERGEGR